MESPNLPSVAERMAAVKAQLGLPANAKVIRLPTMTRSKALKSKTMNGRISEVAGLYMPKSAHRRVNSQRSKVTGISGGGLVNLPNFEDRN